MSELSPPFPIKNILFDSFFGGVTNIWQGEDQNFDQKNGNYL